MTNPAERLPRYTEPSHETENINNDYKAMQNEIENFYQETLKKKVRRDEEQFLEAFTKELSELHHQYRRLEQLNAELSSKKKYKEEVSAMQKERDDLNAECSAIDGRIRSKQEEFSRLKKQKAEMEMENEFLDS